MQLVLLLAAASVVRRFFARAIATPTAAGAIVMAIGIFGSAALQEMPAVGPLVTQPLAIGLLVLWTFLAASYVASCLEGRLEEHTRPLIGRYAIGTWVAATSVLLGMILLGVPEWRPLAVLLGLLALATWLFFLKIIVEGIRSLVDRSSSALVPGAVLLSTVSTQSLALAALELFPDRPSLRWAAAGLIASGFLFYLVGLALVVRSHLRTVGWTLIDDWDNTNCIVHGAMSITGLAVVVCGIGDPIVPAVLWLYVLAAFVAVEVVEAARLLARIKAYGWRLGALTYHVSQWARNFTFGMFYAFTLALSRQPGFSTEPPWLQAIQEPILNFGPYVVLAFLLAEIALYLRDSLEPSRPDERSDSHPPPVR